MVALLLLLSSAFFSVTQPTLQANTPISNSTTLHNTSVTLTDGITVNDTASSRQFLALDEFSSRVLSFCITAAIGVFFGTYTVLIRSKKPIRTTLSVATLAAVLGVLAMLIIVGPASQVVIPFLRSLASGSPEQALLLATTFVICSLAMVFILYRSQKTNEPSKSAGDMSGLQRITVNVRLPVARWGEKSSLSIHIEPTKLVMDLVDAGLKEVGIIAHEGPWYLVTNNKILGPESYHNSIQTSGIQNNQSIMLTDKPSIKTEIPSIPKQPYIRQFREKPQSATSAMDVMWYQNRLREEMCQLRLELGNINDPTDVLFPSWNESAYLDLKKQLKSEYYNAIERLSSTINERNRILKKILAKYGFELAPPDLRADFLTLNKECIRAYETLQETPFFPKSEIPTLVVTSAEDDSKSLKEIRVSLKDGILPYEARFYFVTVKNLTGPSINDLEADFVASHGGGHGSLLMIWSTGRDHLTLHEETMSVKDFMEMKDCLRIDLNPEHIHSAERTVLHQGDEKTFAIVHTNKGVDGVSIPSLATRYAVWFSSSGQGFRFDLYLKGSNFPRRRVASFRVAASSVESLDVTPLTIDNS